MKKIFTLLVFILMLNKMSLMAQVAINTDASQPDASAMLDIKSTSKGMLAPRVTTVQRNAITSPAEGLWVFDTNTHSFWFYTNGGGWQELTTSGGGLTLPYTATVASASTLFSIMNTGTGSAGHFEVSNATNANTAIEAVTNGIGSAITISNTNTDNPANILNVTSSGNFIDISDVYHSQGNAGNFFLNNVHATGSGVRGEINTDYTDGVGGAVHGVASGAGGYGGFFEITQATGSGRGLYVVNAGVGIGAFIRNTNGNSTSPTIAVQGVGKGNSVDVVDYGPGNFDDQRQGNAGNFFVNNTESVAAGVRGEVNTEFGNAGAAGVSGVASGTGGYGGWFETTNPNSGGTTLVVSNGGLRDAVEISNSNANGIGNALNISNKDASHAVSITNSNQSGGGNAIVVVNSSSVNAVEIHDINASSSGAGVFIIKQAGAGPGFVVDHFGTGDLATFKISNVNVARIGNNGRGYFDGGTQTGGADVAEVFDVEGNSKSYEPGDVLVISTSADRTVTKSASAYSELVVGVYATKPGVLMTEESIESDLSGKVPMGVIGVIPTKVCNENGTIHRGDILVTSSRPGFAMKADRKKLEPGQSIGKALEECNATEGKIRVLVNVR